MKLYYNPSSRAVVSKWMLDECGAEYEIVPIDFEKREHKSPEFLKINRQASCRRWSTVTPRSSRLRRSVCTSATSLPKPTLLPGSAHRSAADISR